MLNKSVSYSGCNGQMQWKMESSWTPFIWIFAKAFDTVPHQRLLNKLHGYGIREKHMSG